MVKLRNSITIRILSVIFVLCFAVFIPIVFVYSPRSSSSVVFDTVASDSPGVYTSADYLNTALLFDGDFSFVPTFIFSRRPLVTGFSSKVDPDAFSLVTAPFLFRYSDDYFQYRVNFNNLYASSSGFFTPPYVAISREFTNSIRDFNFSVYEDLPGNPNAVFIDTSCCFLILPSSGVSSGYLLFAQFSSGFSPAVLTTFRARFVSSDDYAFNNLGLPDFSDLSDYDTHFKGYQLYEYIDSNNNYFRIALPSFYGFGFSYSFNLLNSDALDNAYDNGYDDGFTVGESSGYDNGYKEGFSLGESTGYSKGESAGQSVGYTNGYNAGQSDGYTTGFSAGVASANEYTFLGLMGSVIDTPIKAITSLLDFEVLGFNMSTFALSLLTICVILKIVSLISGG